VYTRVRVETGRSDKSPKIGGFSNQAGMLFICTKNKIRVMEKLSIKFTNKEKLRMGQGYINFN
jgi:hypothetical protein